MSRRETDQDDSSEAARLTAQFLAKIDALRNSVRRGGKSISPRIQMERYCREIDSLLFEYFLNTNFSSNPGAAIDSRRKPAGTRS